MAGLISDHNHQRIDKSGEKFPINEVFYVKKDSRKYVSRGQIGERRVGKECRL